MQEPHMEGIANRHDPESCVSFRKEPGEALTGESAGWVLSREKCLVRGADDFVPFGRLHLKDRKSRRSKRAPRGPRPHARTDAPRTGTGRSQG